MPPVRAPRDHAYRAEVRRGALAVVPLFLGVLPFGVAFALLGRTAGFDAVETQAFSALVFAGSAQVAAVGVLEDGGALAAAIVAAVLLNLRYLAVGISVAPSLGGSPLRRLLEAQLATDESWAISQRDGRVDRGRLLGAGLVLLVAWTGGTAVGVIGGSALGDPADYGLDAMFPALFLALLVGQLGSRQARAAALAGALVALVLIPIAPPGVPIVAAAAGAVIALRVQA